MKSPLIHPFVILVDVAAIVAFLLLPASGTEGRLTQLALLAALAGLAAVRPVRIPALRTALAADHPFIFVALAALGPREAVLVALATVLAAAIASRRPPRPIRLLFNLGALALSAAGAAGVFLLLGGRPGGLLLTSLGPLAAAAAVYFSLNTLLVASAVALEKGRPLMQTWRGSCLWTAMSFATGFTLAVAMLAVIDVLLPWGFLLAIAPCWMMLTFFRHRAAQLEAAQRA